MSFANKMIIWYSNLVNEKPKFILSYYKYNIKRISHIVVRYFTSILILDQLMTFCIIFGIYSNIILYNR